MMSISIILKDFKFYEFSFFTSLNTLNTDESYSFFIFLSIDQHLPGFFSKFGQEVGLGEGPVYKQTNEW